MILAEPMVLSQKIPDNYTPEATTPPSSPGSPESKPASYEEEDDHEFTEAELNAALDRDFFRM